MTEHVAQVNMESLYVVVGTLVVMNLGAIGAGLFTMIRLSFYAGRLIQRIDKMELDINAAHRKLRDRDEQ